MADTIGNSMDRYSGGETMQDTTGLILAGGAGRRVGGRDKGLLTWRGAPMAAQVAQRLRPQVARLLISCNRNTDYYATLADATVADSRRDFQGPLAGIEAATNIGLTPLYLAMAVLPAIAVLLLLGLPFTTYFVEGGFSVLLRNIGLTTHYSSLGRGVLDMRDLLYFGSVIYLFTFLTTRMVESRKWS